MKIIFAGTPEFACVALDALLAAGLQVPLVLTQPDRPAGRGLQLHASAVKQCALQHGIAVAQPRSLRLDGKYPEDAAAARAAIEAAQADVMVVAAYGLILPQWVLDVMSGDGPPLGAKAPLGGSAAHAVASVGVRSWGCLNIHASLLPRWRGAAPIHRAIEAGDTHTGITIMQMDAGLDTGDMLLVEKLAIQSTDTTPTLHDKLAALGGRCIVQALQQLERGSLTRRPQPRLPPGVSDTAQAAALGISYAHKIDKAEARIDWSHSAVGIERKVRALTPSPGCTAQILGETIKVTRSSIDSCLRPHDKDYGHILQVNSEGISVQCGEGALLLTELQRAGGKRLPAADFLRGFPLLVGQRFE
ncbi:MAG: methionyl-tRNA formyltransferase [Burkholderiaceae bacterium]